MKGEQEDENFLNFFRRAHKNSRPAGGSPHSKTRRAAFPSGTVQKGRRHLRPQLLLQDPKEPGDLPGGVEGGDTGPEGEEGQDFGERLASGRDFRYTAGGVEQPG